MKSYTIGIDFGTLSGRCVLVDTDDGREVAESVYEYPHAVMDESLPEGRKLPPQYALQHPDDYLEVLRHTVRDTLKKAKIPPEQVKGIGVDFTACTLLPVDQNGMPLCLMEAYRNEPHAYVKLWKHHAAQGEADEINKLAKERKEPWLDIYGGKISSEWVLPKVLQVLREAPEIYNAAARFIEAGDWISWMLTGEETHSAPFAGYKALWNAESGYPSDDFMTALDSRLHGFVGTKLSDKVKGIGEIAGSLDDRGAELTGLLAGTPVAMPMIDAHAAMPALHITGDGELMMIVGTSTCHIVNGSAGKNTEGICGYVKDGVIPGLYTYEAGQAAVGDIFDWFVKNDLPASYEREAGEKKIGLHALLREKASRLRPGESGLLALDWLNGNRSVLDDSELTGMVLGLTLRTKPEEIYRAWIEATAYGTRMITDCLEESGVEITHITAAGGIARKDEMMMQIYADVTGKTIRIAGSSQAGALGSAIYAAVAAGIYPSVERAADAMSVPAIKTYAPDEENHRIYNALYEEYKTLHDYFGRGENDVMKRLLTRKKIQNRNEGRERK